MNICGDIVILQVKITDNYHQMEFGDSASSTPSSQYCTSIDVA